MWSLRCRITERPLTYAVMIIPVQSAIMPVIGSVAPNPSTLSQTITFQNLQASQRQRPVDGPMLKRRGSFAGDTARAATSDEVKNLRRETAACSTNGEPRSVINQTSQSLPPFALLAVLKTLMTDT
jgi:hypothetical protein